MHTPPIVAAFLTIALIAFLFRRDIRESDCPTHGRAGASAKNGILAAPQGAYDVLCLRNRGLNSLAVNDCPDSYE